MNRTPSHHRCDGPSEVFERLLQAQRVRQVSEWEPGMGKLNPKTEYYQINSQQDTITCKQEARFFCCLTGLSTR